MSTIAPVVPGRLRRRLAIAFVLVGGLTAGALATGAYLLVRHSRLQDSADRSVAQARANLAVAATSKNSAQLAAAFSHDTTFKTVIAYHGHVPPGLLPVPADLHRLASTGMAYQRATVQSEPTLIVGAPDPVHGRQLYFYFDESPVWSDLDQLRDVLIAGWLVVLAASAVAGLVLSRKMLSPVAAASAAAHSLAEGLLDTRLPAGGEDEFGAWAASFNSMADALQGKITALEQSEARERRFTADVAHELRTPLTALVNEAGLLARHADQMPAEARRMSELLTRDLARLRRLVEDLMEISRLDSGQEPLELSEVDIATLVGGLRSAHAWDARIELAGAAGAMVVTDRRRLERILANLIGNAIEHGGGRARVGVIADGEGATVEVADDGPGIPPEFRDRLFDRFSKADTARAGGGSGLGLAIASENAALIGGRIDVTSVAGAGARFVLHLPLSPGGTA